jgi:hypothetical protein
MREFEQQQVCFQTIKDYLNDSEKVVYSNFRFLLTNFQQINKKIFNEENTKLLIHILEDYWNDNIKDIKIAESVLLVLIKWCFLERFGISR